MAEMSAKIPCGVIRPNLFLVGAHKAGTSSLHTALSAHPAIFANEPKSAAFFVRPAVRPKVLYGAASSDEECLDIYLGFYRHATGYRYIVDGSDQYTHPRFGTSVGEIHSFDPAARIIYIMRDPIDRTISHYWWNCIYLNETRHVLDAISTDAEYRDCSYYAGRIRAFLDRFSRDQLYVLTLEEFVESPDRELARIFRWLNLDASVARPVHGVRENTTPKIIVQQRSSLLTSLRHSKRYCTFMHVIPKSLRSLARRINERHVDRIGVDVTDVRALLRSRQAEETEELAELLGRNFRQWKTLYGS